MITTFSWFGYDLPMSENFKRIKQAGFDGVMLWWDDSFGDIEYRGNPDLVRKAGLYVENIHAPDFVMIPDTTTTGTRNVICWHNMVPA